MYIRVQQSSHSVFLLLQQGCPGIEGNTVTLSQAGYPCYFDLKKCQIFSQPWSIYDVTALPVPGVGRTPASLVIRQTKISVSQVLVPLSSNKIAPPSKKAERCLQHGFSRNLTPWKEIVSTFRRFVWKQSVRKKHDAMIQSLSNNHYPMQQRSYLSDSTSSEN